MSYVIHEGDCREVMKEMADNSVDSIVTDPPYELGFMGKNWDSTGIANNPEMWKECLRILKPGGHLLSFGGSRTYHRMACAIEDSGFEIRDQIMWVYGSGFPKSLNVGKAIDRAAGEVGEVVGIRKAGSGPLKRDPLKRGHVNVSGGGFSVGTERSPESEITELATKEAKQWDGWGTALKPAHEPICVARKPLTGTVAANVLTYGTGAINIDGCRVVNESSRPLRVVTQLNDNVTYNGDSLLGRLDGSLGTSKAVGVTDLGRWPANFIHDGSDEVLAGFPETKSGALTAAHQITGGFSGSVNCFGAAAVGGNKEFSANEGNASRFFYCAKTSKSDRNEGLGGTGTDVAGANNHPTVKPTSLMSYLVKLVTPPGGTVFDPFTGSGSTGKAAISEGFNFIGAEMTKEYTPIIKGRLNHAIESLKSKSVIVVKSKKTTTVIKNEDTVTLEEFI